MVEAETCPGCGGHLPETTDEQNQHAYVVEQTRCWRCTSLGEAQDKHRKGGAFVHQPHALKWYARRR